MAAPQILVGLREGICDPFQWDGQSFLQAAVFKGHLKPLFIVFAFMGPVFELVLWIELLYEESNFQTCPQLAFFPNSFPLLFLHANLPSYASEALS